MLNENLIGTLKVGLFIGNAEDQHRLTRSTTGSDIPASISTENLGVTIMGNQVFLNVWDCMRAQIMQQIYSIFHDYSSQLQRVVLD